MPDKEQSPSVTELCEDAEWLRHVAREENALVRNVHKAARENIERIATRIEALHAEREKLREALKGMVAFGEEIERRELVGDEGCFWPVEFARAALNASPKDSPDAP